MRNIFNFLGIARDFIFANSPIFCFARVVGYEEWCAADSCVVFTLIVICRLYGHVVGLALDNDERSILVNLVLDSTPDYEVGAC